MKKSNILLLCAVVPAMIWMLICGWLQANAYNVIISGKSCNYAIIDGQENVKQLASFKNIKVVVDKVSMPLMLRIQYGQNPLLSYVNSIKNAVSYSISGDTLCLRIKNAPFKKYDFITIKNPSLKNVNITSSNKPIIYDDFNIYATISGFRGGNLSVKSKGCNMIVLRNITVTKLAFKSDFSQYVSTEIWDWSGCDSLDVDIKGKDGTFILGVPKYAINKKDPKQWMSIKVPASFHREGVVSVPDKLN